MARPYNDETDKHTKRFFMKNCFNLTNFVITKLNFVVVIFKFNVNERLNRNEKSGHFLHSFLAVCHFV
jgi:hypothetical protein